jgi:hypothetical protein
MDWQMAKTMVSSDRLGQAESQASQELVSSAQPARQTL